LAVFAHHLKVGKTICALFTAPAASAPSLTIGQELTVRKQSSSSKTVWLVAVLFYLNPVDINVF
jgi:hypothetical protein